MARRIGIGSTGQPGEESVDGKQSRKRITRKVTFLISDLNDVRLSAYSRKKGVDRSRVVDDALSKLFHGMRIAFPGEQESESEAAA